MLVDIITDTHKSTKRDYWARMQDDKVSCSQLASRFGFDFFDGERRYGYGGYKDDGRWKPIAKKLIKKYKLNKDSSVFDIGCGKGFLLKYINELCGCRVLGGEISDYVVDNNLVKPFEAGKDEIKDYFDLIISINALHNLTLPRLKQAIEEINSHSKDAYIVVESYRNKQELFNLECWNLTGEQFLRPEEWFFLFDEWGYKGDYEFIFFE